MTPRAWPGILAGLLAVGVGVFFAVHKVSPDPFGQALILAGVMLVSGTHVGLLIVAQRRLGPVLKAAAGTLTAETNKDAPK